jgi:hypothetical protein
MSRHSHSGCHYHIHGSYAYTEGHRQCECGCVQSDNVGYNGPNLPCSEINTCDSITLAIEKLEAKICELTTALSNLTSTTSTTSSSSTTTTTSTTMECILSGEIDCQYEIL